MKDIRLNVTAEGKPVYDIMIRDSFADLPSELEKLEIANRRVCIVTETNVASYYLDDIKELLEGKCAALSSFIFEEGEQSKNLETVGRLYQFLIEREFDRQDILLALGGGVVGDLTGFAASTYLRGIDFVQIPTSLLSQVDSSIGGKTGVDFLSYKNMVGAFYMPKLVYINVSTLKTLSDRQYHSGLGEVIKHGLIQDADYYQWLIDHKEMIAKRDLESMAIMVLGSCKIKRAVVEEDPKEHGKRAILNFGHTFGHSIERILNFQYAHGECVGIGCILAANLSRKRSYITDEEYEEVRKIFGYFDFPELPEDISVSEIIEETHHDKKKSHGKIKFILLDEIGQAGIHTDVSEREMAEAFED